MAILSSNDITEKINGYFSCIEKSGNIYWNAGITPTKDNWGLTNSGCAGMDLSASASENKKCTSNSFNGHQCNGFARFIAYLLTGTQLGNVYGEDYNKDVGGGWKKMPINNYAFCPGDIVEVNDGVNEHSAVVLSVNGEDIQFLELWSSWGCMVAHGWFNGGTIWDPAHPNDENYKISMTATNLRLHTSHVIKCPPIEKVFFEPPETPPCGSDTDDSTTPPETPTDVMVNLFRNLYSGDTHVYEENAVYKSNGTLPTYTETGYTLQGWAVSGGSPTFSCQDLPEGPTNLYGWWSEDKQFQNKCSFRD